jgi:hypothetical protein
MRKFQCEHCGQRLSVPASHAGSKGRCPKCKKPVTIPGPTQEKVVAETTSGGPQHSTPVHDKLLLDLPPTAGTAPATAAEPDESEAAYQRLRELHGDYRLRSHEEVPERKLPWVIDVFLYPLNKPGLIILTLSAGGPLLARVMARLCMYATAGFPPLLVFWVIFIIVHYASLLLSGLYITWYVGECIRDSAAGQIRAVDTTASTPGFGELFGRFLIFLVAAAACLAPALMYLSRTRSIDDAFWALYALGGFVFPMALLAVVMFESLRALNPLLLLASIRSTFLHYCALVPFCYSLCLLIPVAAGRLFTESWMLGYGLLFLAFYELLVLAHLLGRFYWRHQERLNWDT